MEDSTKAEIIKGTTEIVKTAYEDAFQPVAQETGKALGTIGKTVNVALAPLQGIVWGWDRIEEFIQDKVSKKLEEEGVEEKDIITPDPDVAVPAVEALRYSKLKDQFASLLATAMNANTQNDAHPAFVEVLKQMNALDAEVVSEFAGNIYVPMLTIEKANDNDDSVISQGEYYGNFCLKLQVKEYLKFSVTIDNLLRLRLIESFPNYALIEKNAYNLVSDSDAIRTLKTGLGSHYRESRGFVRLTEFGQMFLRACC